jgi:GTP-binding protein
MSKPTVAIVGRPNVGKSTLFNRLVGKRLAIVEAEPGVTRDWKEGEARLAGVRFRLLDTPGLEDAKPGTLEAAMCLQAEHALAQADVALLLFDAREGVTPIDRHFANWLRSRGTPVIVIANKCEGRGGTGLALDGFSLGFGAPVPASAEHGEGLL